MPELVAEVAPLVVGSIVNSKLKLGRGLFVLCPVAISWEVLRVVGMCSLSMWGLVVAVIRLTVDSLALLCLVELEPLFPSRFCFVEGGEQALEGQAFHVLADPDPFRYYVWNS